MRSRPVRWRSAVAAVVMVLVCALMLLEAVAGGRMLVNGGLLLAVVAALAAGVWSGPLSGGAAVLVGAALMTAANQVADPGAYAVADDAVFSLVVLGAPTLLGAGWAARGRQVRELRRLYAVRAAQVAAEVETARLAETTRIAGMVQAGVVQTLGGILVRAEGALARGAAGTPDLAAERQGALGEIEQSARETLDQLRAHLGTLRDTPAPCPPYPVVPAGEARPDPPGPGEAGSLPPEGSSRARSGGRPTLALVDVLAGLSTVPVAVEVAVTDHALGPVWAAVLAPLALAWPLTLRRRRPVGSLVAWCVVAVTISLTLVPLQGLVSTILPLLLMASTAGAGLRSWAGRLGGLALLLASSAVMILAGPGGSDLEALLATSLVLVLATAAGVVSAAAAARVRTLDDLVRTVELHRHREVDLAVARQRSAVARDLHDSVAASATIICLQAAAARAVPDQEVMQEALRTIVATARDGVREVRASLDLGGERGGPTPPGGVEEVVAVARRAGLDVHLHTPVPALPAPAEELAVRVVREAVVNASRHAPGARVEVVVEVGPAGLDVSVRDEGAPRGVRTGGPSATPGTGTGLAGLAERVALRGGTLTHGPLRPRGYAVRLRLPLPTGEEEPDETLSARSTGLLAGQGVAR